LVDTATQQPQLAFTQEDEFCPRDQKRRNDKLENVENDERLLDLLEVKGTEKREKEKV
jgi:hypothetical protein